ncbi:PaaI family thioesterase [Shouchella shacheensis]|uniref:PaaI family thioesterase n=1 Tax=Shouchella shacheensis TaxID=1649580 RepID=UPI00073FBBEA|nr:PaaI family thioesterase [Shouchella shacheensis]
MNRKAKNGTFSDHVGFRFYEDEEGKVTVALNVDAHLLNRIDTLHGGVHATMIDNVLGATIFAATEVPSTTIQLSVHYFEPVAEGELIATATILKQSYKLVTAEGVIVDQSGTVVAKGMGTFKLLHAKKELVEWAES